MGWGEGAGRSVGAGKEPRPARACARSLAHWAARGVCVRRPRAPARGRVLLEAGWGPVGPRLRALGSARGGEEKRFPPCGAGSTCLRTDGGSHCSEETVATEGGYETTTRFCAVGFVYLPPHTPPPAPDATEPQEEVNGCYHRCGQTGSPASYRTG